MAGRGGGLAGRLSVQGQRGPRKIQRSGYQNARRRPVRPRPAKGLIWEIHYFYLPPTAAEPSPETILACDLAVNHGGEGRNLVKLSGRVDWLTEEQFQAELAKPHNAEFAAALREAEDDDQRKSE